MTARQALLGVLGVAAVAARAGAADAGPEQAFRAYADALAVGDVAGAKRCVIADDKRLAFLDGRRAAFDAETQFQAAVAKAFPNALPAMQPATRVAEKAPVVHIDHDTATLTTPDAAEPVRLRRVEGVWKVDLNAMYADDAVADMEIFRHALRDVLTAVAGDVAAGKYKSYAEVQSDLETRVKMKLATPDDSATTRPVL